MIARLPHVLLIVALVACPTTDRMDDDEADDDDASDDDDVAGDPWPFLTLPIARFRPSGARGARAHARYYNLGL